MNDDPEKKDKFSIADALFSFFILTTIIGMLIGYQWGMQTPQEQLRGDLKIGEVAFILSVLFGIGGSLVGIVAGSIMYGIFTLLRKQN